jgi:CheY-like chemotaxis protein
VSAGAAAAGRPLSILVVLASPPLRLLARSALEEAFGRSARTIAAREAGSAFEALWLLARERPALALVALDLPVLTGDELVALLRARPEHRDLPVLAVAPRSDPGAEGRAAAAGVAALLRTPFEPDAVAAALAAAGFSGAAP